MYSLQRLQLWMKIWNKEKNTDLTWELRTWNCPFPCLGLGPQHRSSVTCKASYMFTKFSTADSDDVYERLKEYWDTHYLLREGKNNPEYLYVKSKLSQMFTILNIRDQVSKAVLSWHCYTVPEPISPLQVPTKSVSDQWTSLAPAWHMKGRDCFITLGYLVFFWSWKYSASMLVLTPMGQSLFLSFWCLFSQSKMLLNGSKKDFSVFKSAK